MKGMTKTQWRKLIAANASSARACAKAAEKEVKRGPRARKSARLLRTRAAEYAFTAAVMAALTPGIEERAARLAQTAGWACAECLGGGPRVLAMLRLQARMILLAAGLAR